MPPEVAPPPRRRRRRWLLVLALLATLAAAGCGTLGYYGQAVIGHGHIWLHQRDIRDCLADPTLDDSLKERLRLVLHIRDYARDQLGLPVDRDYQDYLDLGRPYVVWNVYAAPEFSLEAKSWWFPFVGRAKYRGYYSERAARRYAARLQKRGYDVYVGGVEAYSTLGYFPDPVLNTFLDGKPARLAEVIFHELAHARLYLRGDSDFNEAFATAVSEQAVLEWLRATGRTQAMADYRNSIERREAFTRLVLQTVAELRQLYAKRDQLPVEELRRRKAQRLAELRARYTTLKVQLGWDDALDDWFNQSLNNAKLSTISTYREYVPGFRALLEGHAGDWPGFYAAAARLGELPQAVRHQRLRELAAGISKPAAPLADHRPARAHTTQGL